MCGFDWGYFGEYLSMLVPEVLRVEEVHEKMSLAANPGLAWPEPPGVRLMLPHMRVGVQMAADRNPLLVKNGTWQVGVIIIILFLVGLLITS